jgi:hypothetical protein
MLLVVSAAGEQQRQFSASVYPMLEKAGCRACHTADGVASPTRLHFPESDAGADRIEAFGRSLVNLVDRGSPAQSLLLGKPTNRARHAGGERIKPGSPEESALREWTDRLSRLSGAELDAALKYRDEENSGRGHRRAHIDLRRLTHSQFNHTVRDLLGDQTSPANQFPPEDFVNGFRNQAQAQSLSPLLIEAYSAAAERIARNAFRGGDTRGLIPCKPSPACRAKFVREFGLKAFRRPLDPEEQARYEKLHSTQRDFLAGAQLVVEAMLQSSSFLFRLEDGADPNWRPYVAASRLSYAIWDTMPDAELFAAAARGDLTTPQAVEKAARRMLDHPRAREALDEFVSQWLRFDRILTASRDRRRYPQFTRETAVAMTEEARVFIGDLVWNDRNFMELYTARYAFPNADLASIYGVTAPQKDFERVALPPDSGRAGLLGQALFLAQTSKPEDASLTARGLFIREQFLCQHVPDPPAGVNTNLPPVTEDKPQTNRDRMSEHASNPACVSCHNLIDPIGFGFEQYDAIGVRRPRFQLQFAVPRREGSSRRGQMKTVDLDIDANGFVAGLRDSNFTSPAQLGDLLAATEQCQECVVKQYFRYVSGRLETPADRPVIRGLLEQFRRSGFRFKELMVALIRSREFADPGENAHVATHHQAR